MKFLFTQLEQPSIVKPKKPCDATIAYETFYNEEVTQYIKDKKGLESTLTALYNVVWGQCSKLLQNKLNASLKFNSINDSSNVAALLREIKLLSNRLEEITATYNSLHEAKKKSFNTSKQRKKH